MSPSSANGRAFRLCPVSQLQRHPLSWLWPWRLGGGKLAMLDGDPDRGKSLVALDLCARLSTGRPFPDGGLGPGPASAIVLSGEDDEGDTVGPRLEGLGADLDRVFVLRQGEDEGAPLHFPADLDLLEAALVQACARLVVIDPITSYLDRDIATASDASVRRALRPLGSLAGKYACAILLVRHLNKLGGTQALYRGAGSIGFVACCRSAWLIAPDPLLPQRRVLAQVKNNLAPPQPSLAYELLSREGAPPGISWLGPAPWTADQLLGRRGPTKGPPPRERARDFLAALLEEGPRTSREIWAEAQQHGLTEHTLRRAKDELGARSVRLWAEGQRISYWLLPGQQLSDPVAPAGGPDDLEPWLAPLREKYPPSTPLDEL